MKDRLLKERPAMEEDWIKFLESKKKWEHWIELIMTLGNILMVFLTLVALVIVLLG